MSAAAKVKESEKSRSIALVLCFFFGWIGLHRFYVNKVVTGLIMMFTFGGFGMWIFVDVILILAGMFQDSEEKLLLNWGWKGTQKK